MFHCIQNRTFHLLSDVTLFNPLKGGLFWGKNECTENSSNHIFQHVYYILPKRQFLALLNKGLGRGASGIILWIFNTTSF